MRQTTSLLLAVSAALVAGCVSLPPERLPIAPNPAGSAVRDIGDLGSGAILEPSLRFLVKAYGVERAKAVSKMAEEDYGRLMAHTGLFSFRPGGLYPITIYRDAEEYLEKTGMPGWSGGVAIGNAIYTHASPELPRTLAHEITHLIFQEYMGGPGHLRWLNEGLAVYEELQVATGKERRDIEAWMAGAKEDPMPLDEMVRYVPDAGPKVHLWYGQAASVVKYLVETGGRNGIARLMEETRHGTGLDRALALSFPTLCEDLRSLELRWLNKK